MGDNWICNEWWLNIRYEKNERWTWNDEWFFCSKIETWPEVDVNTHSLLAPTIHLKLALLHWRWILNILSNFPTSFQVHLLCLLSCGFHGNRTCNDVMLQAVTLSLVPARFVDEVADWDISALGKVTGWFRDHFVTDSHLSGNTAHLVNMNSEGDKVDANISEYLIESWFRFF